MRGTSGAAAVASVMLVAVPGGALARTAHRQEPIVRATAQVARGPESTTLTRAGTLLTAAQGSAVDAQIPGGGPAMSRDTLAVVAFPSRRSEAAELLLYSKPNTGAWSTAKPRVAPLGAGLDSTFLAAGDGFAAINAYADSMAAPLPGGCSQIAVFAGGASGFSGMLSPSACLTDPLVSVRTQAAGSNAVVATGAAYSSLDVFAEPAGGWAGTLTPAAQLQTSDGADLNSVAMSGTTVAAVGTSAGRKPAVYVFTEPASGWSGVIQETARIPLAVVGLQLSGRTIVAYGAGTPNAAEGYVERAPVWVLRRPAGGWAAARPPHPSGYVVVTDDGEDVGLEPGTLAGNTVALSNVTNCDQSQYAPCLSTVYALDGLGSASDATAQLPIGPSLSLRNSDGTPIVGDGSTLAVGADGIDFYTVAHPTPATVRRTSLTRLAGPHPTLRLSVLDETRSSPLAALRILLPAQLGGRGRARTIAFRPTRRSATVTLRGLTASPALRRAVRRITNRGGHTRLTVLAQAVGATGLTSESRVTFTISR
jgi:hypothetical protein